MIEQEKKYKNIDTDIVSKFRAAGRSLSFTKLQCNTFLLLEETFSNIGDTLDTPQLYFDIGKTPDDEIYISHTSTYGINNILIYEDGTMAHSFIGIKESEKQDFLYFLEPVDSIDYEQLFYKFFSFR